MSPFEYFYIFAKVGKNARIANILYNLKLIAHYKIYRKSGYHEGNHSSIIFLRYINLR